MSGAHHFYITFNPNLNKDYDKGYTQAHEFFDLLVATKKKNKDAVIHWGKIIGKDRESSLDIEHFSEIVSKNKELGLSTHLYITDFHNIWCAQVSSVSKSINKKEIRLAFYEGKNVEIWFEINDMVLLEYSHEETTNKISDLYIDNSYNEIVINGLSPFTTKIDYPAIIQDIAEEQYFDEFEPTSELSHLCLRPHSAVYSTGHDQVLRCLQTYAFNDKMYGFLPHAAKLEIEAAELDMLEQRHHNLRGIAFSYLKAFEIILNDLVIHHIKRKGLADNFYVDPESSPPKLFLQQEKDYYISLKYHQKNFSINQLIYFVDKGAGQSHLSFKKAFSNHKKFINLVRKELGDLVRDNQFIKVRNILAHNDATEVSNEDAMAIRNMMLGVGCHGLIAKLYQSFYPENFENTIKVVGNYDKGQSQQKRKKKANLKLVG